MAKDLDVLKAAAAIGPGLRLCLFSPRVRRFAKWPWIIGAVSYLLCIYVAVRLHHPILVFLAPTPIGIWSSAIFWICWLLVALGLIIAVMVVGISVILVFTSVFQSSIAQATLIEISADSEFPELSLGAEVSRTIGVEIRKLVWIMPLMLLFFLVGLIPILAPLALVCGAWLLAYQFIDVVMDLFHIPVSDRFRFARANFVAISAFGLVLTALCAIPFLGILLAPAATAGAAWVMGVSGAIKGLKNNG